VAKYFIRSVDRLGSCYYEFYVGTWDRKKMQFWHNDSICITDCEFHSTGLAAIIAEVIPHYDPYGNTVVTKRDWEIMTQKAAEAGGESQAVVEEVSEWVKQNFLRHKVFTILGI
jgi:hypothetical protein